VIVRLDAAFAQAGYLLLNGGLPAAVFNGGVDLMIVLIKRQNHEFCCLDEKRKS
jgi:hypothetical protein